MRKTYESDLCLKAEQTLGTYGYAFIKLALRQRRGHIVSTVDFEDKINKVKLMAYKSKAYNIEFYNEMNKRKL